MAQGGAACHLPNLTPRTSSTKSYVEKEQVHLAAYQKKHTSPSCPPRGQEAPELFYPNFPSSTLTHTAPPQNATCSQGSPLRSVSGSPRTRQTRDKEGWGDQEEPWPLSLLWELWATVHPGRTSTSGLVSLESSQLQSRPRSPGALIYRIEIQTERGALKMSKALGALVPHSWKTTCLSSAQPHSY